jgi:hypothetical protein
MELVSITVARPGQILARAVTNPTGATLCPAGYRLTPDVLARLRNAGVESLLIEGDNPRGPRVEERIEALRRRFEGVDDPILLQIEATIERRLNLMRLEHEKKP